MSRVEKEYEERFGEITNKKYADQAKWFLNGFFEELSDEAKENVWIFVQKFIEFDEKKAEGNDLDEFFSHKFLEGLGQTMTVIEMRNTFREIDVDFNKRIALTEYLMYVHKKGVKEMVEAPQGGDPALLAEAQSRVDAAQSAVEEMQVRLATQKAAEEAVVKADEENKAALAALQAEEEAYNSKIAKLEKQSNEGGVVKRNKAKAELEMMKSEDPLPLRRAKINQEATVRKSEKAKKAAEEATLQVEAAVAEAEVMLQQATDYLGEIKKKGGTAMGDIWWMEREIEEKRKYLPGYKGKKV